MTASDGSRALHFHEPISNVTRVMCGVGGLVVLTAPYELLIRPGLLRSFHWSHLPFWLISAGALSIALPLLIGALLGPTRSLAIDRDARRIAETGRLAAGGFTWRRSWGFDAVTAIEVIERDWSDADPDFAVVAKLARRKHPLMIAARTTRAGAKDLAAQIRQTIL